MEAVFEVLEECEEAHIWRKEGIRLGFWDWLQPSEPTRRFIPATGVAAVGVLIRSGQQLNWYSVFAAFVLVPIGASALNLLFRPIIRASLGYHAVIFRLSDRLVKAISKHAQLSARRQETLRLALAEHYRPLVSEQFEAFWDQRGANHELDKELERRDVSTVSLFFLGFAYLGCFLISFSHLSQTFAVIYYYPAYVTALTEGLPVSLGFLVVASVFLFAARSEIRAYRRLLWDRIPLLRASSETLDSNFWQERASYFESRRTVLGELEAKLLADGAREKRVGALRAELERDFVEQRVSHFAGEDPQAIRILLTAVSESERGGIMESGFTRRILQVMLLVTTVLLIAAGVFPQSASVILVSLAVAIVVLLTGLDPLGRYIGALFQTRAILKRIGPELARTPEPSLSERAGVNIVSRVKGFTDGDKESKGRNDPSEKQ